MRMYGHTSKSINITHGKYLYGLPWQNSKKIIKMHQEQVFFTDLYLFCKLFNQNTVV